jgi:hypothetical protein
VVGVLVLDGTEPGAAVERADPRESERDNKA